MRLAQIKIENILGIKELEFSPGQITEISGKNGSGKTSILEAIKGALKGGHDATLLKAGETQGRVVLVLDNGLRIKKTITSKGSELELTDENGEVQKTPQTVINKLIDMMSINPVEFLTAKPKDRTAKFLEVIPLNLPSEKLAEIIKEIDLNFNLTGNPLEVVHRIQEQIYNERTNINREKKQKDGSITQLKESLIFIPLSVEEIEAKISELKTKKTEYNNKKNEYLEQIEKELYDKKFEFEQEKNMKVAELKKQISNIEFECSSKIADINLQSSEAKNNLNESFNAKLNQVNEELTKLRENQKNIGAYLNQKELINQFTNEAKLLDKQAQRLTTGLKEIEALKNTMFTQIPITGLTIIDGELFRNEVSFDRLNTAQQIEIAIEVAKLRAGELGFVCVDGLEKFDTETFEIFKDQALKSGLQFIITKVDNGEFLRVTTV